MIQILDKAKCCGCNACVQKCPKQCILMREDEEGFLYPEVNVVDCINCGLCDKVCPVLNQEEERKPLQVFAAKNKNEGQRLRSSSGGIFIALAEYIIEQGGVVFGARFDENWAVEHAYAETIEELEPFMRSKYVQSNVGDTYQQTEQFLKTGRPVLFVGTSCQIAGLKRFLRKDYKNLFAVDCVCHGVPSPSIWRDYLKEILNDMSDVSITEINFREKQLGGYTWNNYGFVVKGKAAKNGNDASILYETLGNNNLYMKGFISNLYLRLSCYECPAKAGRSSSDITLGDFWGIEYLRPYCNDDKGMGAVLVYSSKGLELMRNLNIQLIPINYEEVLQYSSFIYKSAPLTNQREQFWKIYFETKNLSFSIKKLIRKPIWKIFILKIRLLASKVKRTLVK